MKPDSLSLLLGVIACLAPTSEAIAGPPPPRPPHQGNAGSAEPRPQPAVIEEELGTTRDKFETYRKLTFEGFRFYVKSDETLRVNHAGIYQKIQANTLTERLTVTQARTFVLRLLEISRANADAASQAITADSLDELSKSIDSSLLEKVDGGILTPDLNRREWLMDELVHFASDSSLSDARRTSLVNRLEDLLAAEDRAKQSGDLSDSERNKLLESSVETWISYLRAFHR